MCWPSLFGPLIAQKWTFQNAPTYMQNFSSGQTISLGKLLDPAGPPTEAFLSNVQGTADFPKSLQCYRFVLWFAFSDVSKWHSGVEKRPCRCRLLIGHRDVTPEWSLCYAFYSSKYIWGLGEVDPKELLLPVLLLLWLSIGRFKKDKKPNCPPKYLSPYNGREKQALKECQLGTPVWQKQGKGENCSCAGGEGHGGRPCLLEEAQWLKRCHVCWHVQAPWNCGI